MYETQRALGAKLVELIKHQETPEDLLKTLCALVSRDQDATKYPERKVSNDSKELALNKYLNDEKNCTELIGKLLVLQKSDHKNDLYGHMDFLAKLKTHPTFNKVMIDEIKKPTSKHKFEGSIMEAIVDHHRGLHMPYVQTATRKRIESTHILDNTASALFKGFDKLGKAVSAGCSSAANMFRRQHTVVPGNDEQVTAQSSLSHH